MVERRGRKPCCRNVNLENWDKWASIFSLRIASSTLQTTDVRPMGLNRFGSAVLGGNWGNNDVAPVMRGLGGLEREVKNAGVCRGYVGTEAFKSFGKEPIRAGSLIGVVGFKSSRNQIFACCCPNDNIHNTL